MMVIQLTREQKARIEEQAKERGYDDITEYVLALVEADAEDAEDLIDDSEQDAIDLEERFREAWHSAMTGEGVRPADDVLAELRARRKQENDGNYSPYARASFSVARGWKPPG
jgi:oligoendopeptidase F